MDIVHREQDKQRERTELETVVYVGKSGTGKSHRCFYDPDYQESGYKFPSQAPGKVFFDGYENQRVIWFDEFGGTTIPFSLFLRLCDKWDNRVETKGGTALVSGLRKVLISTTTYPACWWRNCPKYLEDPRQLWRRLTKVYYLPRVPGHYCEPVLIERPEGFDDSIASALDAEAADEIERGEAERRRAEALELARELRRRDGLDRAGESQRLTEPDGDGSGGSSSITRLESDLLGSDDDGWINTVD